MSQGKKSPFRAYNLRKWSQALSLAAFLILLIYLDPLTSADSSGNNIFLRLSPLSGLSVSITARELVTQYWPALVLIAMTLLMGRFFCGWVCPFGTTIDLTDKLFKRKRANENYTGWKIYDGKRLKYYLLAFLLLSLFISRQLVGWFDPLSLATNTYSILIHPYLVVLLAGVFDFLHGFPIVGPLTAPVHELSDKVLFVEREPFFRNHTAFLIIFLGIISFGLVYRRYWCRNLCPLGALLALASIGAYLQRRVRKDCEVCDLCRKGCRMGCITEEGRVTLAGECILCMDCQEVCPSDAIRFRGSSAPQLQEVDLSKRGLVTACLAGVAAVPMLGFNFPWRSGKGHVVIRPPASVDEGEFLARCVRCGECMKVCKTNGLHPTLVEAGLEAAWTPRLIPRIGHCEYTCTLCGHVCPSGAIKPLELSEKQKTAIGKARIDRSRCIPWVGYAGLPSLKKDWHDVNCGVCEEVCPVPTKAIHFNTYTDGKGREIRRPFVREKVCNGCGFCEYVCPVVGRAAIVVEGIQPQIPIKLEESVKFRGEELLPEAIGEWTMLASPLVYAGEGGLYEYIDGAAEPYLSYSYQQVTVVRYGDVRGREVLVEAWTFGTNDDAFGAYTYDRSGSRYDLGNEATISENYLWVWKGRHYLRFEPSGTEVGLDEVSHIAETILDRLPPGESVRPTLLNYLPYEGLLEGRTKFFHSKIILDNIYISDEVIEENVFGLGKGTDVVVAEYMLGEDLPTMKLMLVEYPGDDSAHKAWKSFVELKKSWGESPLLEGTLQCFEDKSGRYSTVYYKGRFLVATFLALDRMWAEDYTRAVGAEISSR
ncbi:MAG: DUF6599 family protein [Candidatus Brocadiales bacterium]